MMFNYLDAWWMISIRRCVMMKLVVETRRRYFLLRQHDTGGDFFGHKMCDVFLRRQDE